LAIARHPAQVVVTDSGNVQFEDGLMFQEETLRVFVVTRTSAVRWSAAASPRHRGSR
jgi:hypothetical protein